MKEKEKVVKKVVKIGALTTIATGLLFAVIVFSISTVFVPKPAHAFSLVYKCTGAGVSATPYGANGAMPNGEHECGFVDLVNQINQLITDAFILAIPLATIVFTWAGVKLMTSQGNQSAMKDAKRMLWATAIGFLFICAAWLIVYFITTSLGCTTCTQYLSGSSATVTTGS